MAGTAYISPNPNLDLFNSYECISKCIHILLLKMRVVVMATLIFILDTPSDQHTPHLCSRQSADAVLLIYLNFRRML